MTECITQLAFLGILKTQVVADFSGGNLTSDAGVLFVREVDDRLELTARLARHFLDRRDPAKVRHQAHEQFRQRIYQICCGYEDCNDADTLRSDPALKIACGREPETGANLASQPTLSRFENAAGEEAIKRMNRELLETYVKTRKRPGERIVIDVDSTDDPTHGQQEFSFFHGFYNQHMFHPLLCYDGETGDLLAANLRPGNVHSANGVVKMLKRVVKKIRKRFFGASIVIRGDAGFCVPRLYRFCERWGLGYVLGLITNATLKKLHAPLLARAEAMYEEDKTKVRLLGEVGYKAKTWDRFRRVIMKAEAMPQGTNRRFVVTNLDGAPVEIYDFYTMRGDVENRIKELKNALAADRLSCCRFEANRFRLLLHCAAYVLMHHLRRRLAGTELETAQFDTIRLRLLKVGARVRQTVRRVWVHVASSYPYKHLWQTLHGRLMDPAPS
jgi:hypothetical protein